MELTHMSLFSGIGGIDLAAEWAGFETVAQCEIDDYATKVLEKNFPNVERWRDIRDVTNESFRERTGIKTLTLLSGGFPCQPHSTAGKRLASADERDLWSEFARIIREIDPNGCWVKTFAGYCQVKMDGSLDEFCGTWPKWGIVSDGAATQPRGLEPYIDESGYSLLPTAHASDGDGFLKINKTDVQTSIWKYENSKNLGKSPHSKKLIHYFVWQQKSLNQSAELYEMIMGFPKGWTDLDV